MFKYDNSEIQTHYEQFYDDVFPEFKKFGDIVQFKVRKIDLQLPYVLGVQK